MDHCRTQARDAEWRLRLGVVCEGIVVGLTVACSCTDGGKSWDPMHVALCMAEEGELPRHFHGVPDACLLVDARYGSIVVLECWMHSLRNRDGNFHSDLAADSEDWTHQ